MWPSYLMDDFEKQQGTSSVLYQALCIMSNPLLNSNWSYSPETLNLAQNQPYLSLVTLKFDGWPRKTIGHLFYVTSKFEHHFIVICEFKLELQTGKSQFGSKSIIFLALWPSNLMDDQRSLVITSEKFMMIPPWNIPSSLEYKTHFSRQLNCWSLRCSWSIACRRCSNYIFILNLTSGFNRLSNNNYKMRQETFKFWDLVALY